MSTEFGIGDVLRVFKIMGKVMDTTAKIAIKTGKLVNTDTKTEAVKNELIVTQDNAGIVSDFNVNPFSVRVGNTMPVGEKMSVRAGNTMPVSEKMSVRVGNIVAFGKYNWRVLDVRGDKALLIAENVTHVEFIYSNDSYDKQTWEICRLRKWLNEDFYLATFSSQERSKILLTTNINDYMPADSGKTDNSTQDKIFLLSISEVIKYFGSNNQAKIATYNDIAVDWYLRTPGVSTSGTLILYDGQIDNRILSPAEIDIREHVSLFVSKRLSAIKGKTGGVRPAFWLNLGDPIAPIFDII